MTDQTTSYQILINLSGNELPARIINEYKFNEVQTQARVHGGMEKNPAYYIEDMTRKFGDSIIWVVFSAQAADYVRYWSNGKGLVLVA